MKTFFIEGSRDGFSWLTKSFVFGWIRAETEGSAAIQLGLSQDEDGCWYIPGSYTIILYEPDNVALLNCQVEVSSSEQLAEMARKMEIIEELVDERLPRGHHKKRRKNG